MVALRQIDRRLEPERPGVERIERARALQFGAAGVELAFDPRQIPTEPAVGIGGIRIERNGAFNSLLASGKSRS